MSRQKFLSVSLLSADSPDVGMLISDAVALLYAAYCEWFRLADRKLSSLAAQALSNSYQRSACLDAMQALHKYRRMQENDFRAGLTNCFNEYFSDGARFNTDNPMATNDGKVKLHPAVFALQERIGCYYPASLAQVNAALNYLTRRNHSIEQLPFSPQNLLAFFNEHVTGYGFDQEILPSLIEQFEKPYLLALQETLLTTKRWLSQRESLNETPAHTTLTVRGKPNTFRGLQSLLNQPSRAALPGSANAGKANTKTLASAEFLHYASVYQNIQWQALTGDAVLETTLGARDFRHWLCQTLSAEETAVGPIQLSRAQDDVITLIALIFEELFFDAGGGQVVPQHLAVLINRLQMPVLKAAYLDKDFFSQTQHPARRCLNRYVSATVGWHPMDNRVKEDALYQSLQQSVIRLLYRYQQDHSVFDLERDNFDATLAAQNNRREKTMQRTLMKERGRLQIDNAATLIDALLLARKGSTTLASAGAFLLEGPWRQYLLHVYLTEGPDGDTWPDALITTDQLVGCLQATGEPHERLRWTPLMPGLMRRLNEALTTIKYPCHELAGLNKAMWQHQIDHLRLRTHELRQVKVLSKPAPLNPAWFTHAMQVSRQRREQPDPSILNLLTPGQWVSITQEKRTSTVLFAAYLQDVGLFLFVTGAGVKFASFTAENLKELVRDNRLVIRDSLHWTNTAIDAITHSLMSKSEKDHSMTHAMPG